MFGKSWEMIKRGMAVALSVSLLAGAMSVSSSLPTAAASTKRVEVGTKGNVTINLDGREVWQAAADAMQKAQPVTGDIADRIMAQTGSNGNPVVLEDDIYKMELPAKALKGLPTGLGMEMYISAGAEDVAEDYTAAEEGEAAAVVAEVASASDLEATGVAEKPVRDFFASSMFSLIKENDEAAPAGGAAAAGGEGYELNGSEHIYFVLSNATDQDVNYTVKLGDLEILKTKVLKSHGDTTGVIGASVSDLIGVPASTSNMVRATESDMATASNLMEEAELTDDVVAKVVRTTLKNFFIIYRSEETALGTKAMVVTTADMKFKSKDGGVFTTRGDKMVLAVRDIDKNSEEYKQAAATLQNNNVDHADFAAVDISFRKGGASEDYEPCQGQIVNVRIETKAIENFDPESMSIQHHLDDGSLETVAGTTKKTVVEISDDAAEAVNNTVAVTEDEQTEITVEKKEDENVYTFDEEANKAAMEAQLSTAGKSEFKMEVGDGETALTNDVKESGAPKKASAAQTEVKKNSVTKTISSAVDANGVKTEVQEEQGNGDIKVEDGKIVADFVVDSFSIYTIVGQGVNTVEYLTADGKTLKITVTFDEDEVIPEGAILEVTELSEEDDGWIDRSLRLGEVLQEKYGYVVISDARFLDIKIKVNGEEIEPKEPVEVRVEYAEEFDTEYTYDYVNPELKPDEKELGSKHFAMVHYVNGAADVLESDITEGDGCITESVSETTSFSEYDVAYFTEDKIDDVDRSGQLPVLEIAGKSTSGVTTFGATRAAGAPPAHGKNLVNKGDGTYDIHLNVTGDADTTSEVSNVNVILVYDTSTSMSNSHNYGPYYVDTYTQNNTGRYGTDGNGNFFNLYYRSGGRYRTLNNDTYMGTVYSNAQGTEYDGTRYSQTRTTRADVAEPVVRSFVNSLYSYQNPDDPTNIQTTFITFNGSPTERVSWTTDSSDITDYLVADGTNNSYNHTSGFYASGTNWEMALRAVETALSNKPDNDPTYVVFITDGAPTTSARITTSGTQYEECYTDARDEALRVQNAVDATGGDFYSIYAYGDETDWLATMMYYANNGVEPSSGRGTSFNTKGYYKASDTAALASAISEIFDAIVDTLGITSVSIEDGTTSEVELSTGGSATADLLDVNTDSFRYTLSWNVLSNGDGTYGFTMPDKVTGEDVAYTVSVSGTNITITWDGGSATYTGNIEFNVLTVDWTEATDFYKFAPPAAQFADPDVTWNLNSVGTLLNGVTYDVAFECYPSQYTLDLIADLKNGYTDYDSLDANVKKYLLKDGNDYVLATNTEARLNYTDSRTEDGPQSTTYVNPDPQSTAAAKSIAVSKNWSNAIDDREKPESLIMHVTRDGVGRYELELNDADSWTDEAFISYGIMTIHDGNIVLKTTGHEYSFSEPKDMEYYWELQVPTLRPMLINTVETLLVEVKESEAPVMSGANATAIGQDGHTYYKLTTNGEVNYYKVDEAVAQLQAENHRRSYFDVVKTVTGTNIPEGDVFPFTMTVTNSNAASGTADDLNSDYWVWFSVYDTINGAMVISDDLVSGTGINRETNASGYTGYYYAPSGTEISVNMQNGYSLRFLNLPTGSTYEVTEEELGAESSYSFVDIKRTRSYKETKEGDWIVDPDYTQTVTDSQTISGTIDLVDSAYKAEVTNTYKTVDVKLKKVDEKRTALDGSTFVLKRGEKEVGTYSPDSKDEEVGNPVDLGGLGVGIYQLSETVAPTNYKSTAPVYFQVYKDTDGSLKVQMVDAQGNKLDDQEAITSENGIYTITIPNERLVTSLSVTKLITGSLGNKTRKYNFKLQMGPDANPLTDQDWSPEFDGEIEATYVDAEKVWKFTLGDKDTISITNAPVGELFKVTEDEANQDGYTTSFRIGEIVCTDTYARAMLTEGTPIAVTVENKLDPAVPTGIHTDSTIWRWLIGACFLMFFGSVLYGRRKRRQ